MGLIQDVEPSALIFFALALLVVGSAAGVALSRNILYAGFSLMCTLAGIAGLYLYMGADFLGIAQLIIYVGGILVLILFAILLTNKIGDLKITNASVSLPLGGGVAALMLMTLTHVFYHSDWPQTEPVAAPQTARLGEAFLREYLLPFELTSVLLLMALVGAMVLARRAARAGAPDASAAERAEDVGAERLT